MQYSSKRERKGNGKGHGQAKHARLTGIVGMEELLTARGARPRLSTAFTWEERNDLHALPGYVMYVMNNYGSRQTKGLALTENSNFSLARPCKVQPTSRLQRVVAVMRTSCSCTCSR